MQSPLASNFPFTGEFKDLLLMLSFIVGVFVKSSSTLSRLTCPNWKVFNVKPRRAVGNTNLSTYSINAIKPPIVSIPSFISPLPSARSRRREIDEIHWRSGINVLAVLARCIAGVL